MEGGSAMQVMLGGRVAHRLNAASICVCARLSRKPFNAWKRGS